MEANVTERLTRERLRRLAGGQSFESGEEYAATGAVGSLRWDESSIRASVQRARLGATLGEASRTLIAVAPISDTLIHEAARRLGRAARSPARVILFGSYARGEPDTESDIDFLVVQQDGFSHRREIVRLQETLSPLRIPAEVLVVSHDEAAQPERAGDAVRDALAEGVVLYEST